MTHPSIAMRTARGQPGETTKPQPPTRKGWLAARPGTALQDLIERWTRAGLPRSVGVPFVWLRRLRDRHELAALSEAQIRDVGLDPSLVRRESEKPFWMA
jgi:uncharacterized protein YjiS (DUF1127 family)